LVGTRAVGVLVSEDLIVEELIPENGQLTAGVGDVVQIVLEVHQVVVGKLLVELGETIGAPAITLLEVLGEELEQIVRGLTISHEVDGLDAVAVRFAVTLQLVEVLEELDEVDVPSVHVLHAAVFVEHRVDADGVRLVLQRAGGIFGIAHRRQGSVGFRRLGRTQVIVEEHAVEESPFGHLSGALVLLGDAQEVEGLVPWIDLAVQDLLQGFAVHLRGDARLAGSLEPIDEEAEVLVGGLVFTPCLVIGDVVGSQHGDAVQRNEPGGGFAQWEHGDLGLPLVGVIGVYGSDDLIMDGGSRLGACSVIIPRMYYKSCAREEVTFQFAGAAGLVVGFILMALPRAVAQVEGKVDGVSRDRYPVDHRTGVAASRASVDSPVVGVETPALPALYIRKDNALLVESHLVERAF